MLHIVKAPPDSESWSRRARRSLGTLKTKALLELGRMARVAKDDRVTTKTTLSVGLPEDEILKVAESTRAELIVMGTHGRAGLEKLRLGSVAGAVLRKARCPVLTVRAASVADVPLHRRQLKLHRFLVAMDFSVSSDAALRTAAMLAERLHVRISLLHVFDPWAHVGRAGAGVREFITHKLGQRAQKFMSPSQTDLLSFDRIVVPGDAVEVILDQAKRMKADVIVMGTNAPRGLQRLLRGSVAGTVVRRAGCPVLVVKAADKSRNI